MQVPLDTVLQHQDSWNRNSKCLATSYLSWIEKSLPLLRLIRVGGCVLWPDPYAVSIIDVVYGLLYSSSGRVSVMRSCLATGGSKLCIGILKILWKEALILTCWINLSWGESSSWGFVSLTNADPDEFEFESFGGAALLCMPVPTFILSPYLFILLLYSSASIVPQLLPEL